MRIAVALPVRNEAKHLEGAVASLVEQTRCPDLIVIAENGSSDATPDIAQELAARNPGLVELHRVPRPLDAVENWRRARSLAIDRCDLFMWLGGHDRVSSDYLEALEQAHRATPDACLAVPALVSEAPLHLGDSTPRPVTEDFDYFVDPNITRLERVHRVALRLGDHAFIHGLWRAGFVAGIPLHAITNDDRLWLMRAASDGVVRAAGGQIVRGLNRPPEGSSSPERRLRYRRAGIDTGLRSVAVYSWEASRIILPIPESSLRRRFHVLARVLGANLGRSKAPWIKRIFTLTMVMRRNALGLIERR